MSKSCGAFRALEDVNMAVHENELVSVVGPNGAGKTTLVNLFTGLLSPTSGEVLFMGTISPALARSRSLIEAWRVLSADSDFSQINRGGNDRRGGCLPAEKRWRLVARLSATYRSSSASVRLPKYLD